MCTIFTPNILNPSPEFTCQNTRNQNQLNLHSQLDTMTLMQNMKLARNSVEFRRIENENEQRRRAKS